MDSLKAVDSSLSCKSWTVLPQQRKGFEGTYLRGVVHRCQGSKEDRQIKSRHRTKLAVGRCSLSLGVAQNSRFIVLTFCSQNSSFGLLFFISRSQNPVYREEMKRIYSEGRQPSARKVDYASRRLPSVMAARGQWRLSP